MLWIYNIGIACYGVLLKIAAVFNTKAKLFVEGRKNIFVHIEEKMKDNERPIWFHFASLGEFEQGRPVLEQLKHIHPEEKIIITFFSPSGYEIRKNYALADVFYLPLDTKANAKQFIELVNPKLAIFTKYEFWHHYFQTLDHKQIPLFLISSIFRADQLFFKWYGAFYRNMLQAVTHFFVQNNQSIQLLNRIGIDKVSLAGDTRFDRVYENAKAPKQLPIIESFCGQSPVLIAGSTWLPDEKILADLITKYPDWKVILAPHEIGQEHIRQIEQVFPEAIKYSTLNSLAKDSPTAASHLTSSILIIDNIGMLSSLYQYGKLAYIGGGFGVGIHNTLEAAAFGLPVIFGPKYDKFQEAKDLINIGAAKSVATGDELIIAFEDFKDNENASTLARDYVVDKKGATGLILKHITPFLAK